MLHLRHVHRKLRCFAWHMARQRREWCIRAGATMSEDGSASGARCGAAEHMHAQLGPVRSHFRCQVSCPHKTRKYFSKVAWRDKAASKPSVAFSGTCNKLNLEAAASHPPVRAHTRTECTCKSLWSTGYRYRNCGSASPDVRKGALGVLQGL